MSCPYFKKLLEQVQSGKQFGHETGFHEDLREYVKGQSCPSLERLQMRAKDPYSLRIIQAEIRRRCPK